MNFPRFYISQWKLIVPFVKFNSKSEAEGRLRTLELQIFEVELKISVKWRYMTNLHFSPRSYEIPLTKRSDFSERSYRMTCMGRNILTQKCLFAKITKLKWGMSMKENAATQKRIECKVFLSFGLGLIVAHTNSYCLHVIQISHFRVDSVRVWVESPNTQLQMHGHTFIYIYNYLPCRIVCCIACRRFGASTYISRTSKQIHTYAHLHYQLLNKLLH